MVVKEEEPQTVPEETTEVEANIPEITLPILKIIKEVQQQHGLRHGDYQRYRGYCSRRIRRLRKVLKIPQSDRRHFKRRDVTEAMVKDERYLQVPLMLAERAWGYAMQLRQESNTEPRKRFHLVSRLRKATAYALHLQHLCENTPCDARTRLEAQAYVAWMHGAFHFELQLWKPAIENFKKAQMVYEKLSAALPEEEQNVYKARVEEITPNLRYCAYNVGDETAIDDLMRMRGQAAHSELLANLDELMAQSRSRRAAEGGGEDEISWKGRTVIVRPERARAFLVAERQLAQAMSQAADLNARIALLEAHLLECKDAVAAARDEAKAKNVSSTPLLGYLTWVRLTRTIERNRLMVSQAVARKARPQDLTRLHEIVLQNLQELGQVPGLEDDADHQREVEAQCMVAKASRSFQMARTLAAAGRWREAVGLFRRAEKRVAETLAHPEAIAPEQRTELANLQLDITAAESDAHAHAVLEAEGEGDSEETTPAFPGRGGRVVRRPLAERLGEYREDPTLTSKNPNVFRLPPDMRPIPCKPLFFDLACNMAEFPSLDDKFETAGKKQAGVTGFVKGLLGWGGAAK